MRESNVISVWCSTKHCKGQLKSIKQSHSDKTTNVIGQGWNNKASWPLTFSHYSTEFITKALIYCLQASCIIRIIPKLPAWERSASAFKCHLTLGSRGMFMKPSSETIASHFTYMKKTWSHCDKLLDCFLCTF